MAEVRKLESVLRFHADRLRLSNLERGLTRFPPPPRPAPGAHARPDMRGRFGDAPDLSFHDGPAPVSLIASLASPPAQHARPAMRERFGELRLTPHDLDHLPPEYVAEWLATGQFNLFSLDDLDRLPHETLKALLDMDPDLADRYFEHNLRQAVSSADFSRRLEIALFLAGKHLDQEVAGQLYQLFSAENIAITSSVLAFWALSHVFGVGEVIDAVLLAAAVVTAAQDLGAIADALWDFFELSQNATCIEDLDKAGQKMAFVISKVGIAAILALILKGGSRRSPGMGRSVAPGAAAAVPKGRAIPVLTRHQALALDYRALSKAARKMGMTDGAAARTQRIAMTDRVRIKVRPAGLARGERLLGGSPKIEKLKMNTITPDDLDIGAPREGLGQVGFFQPREPNPAIKVSNPRRYDQLQARYQQRKQQYQEWFGDVQELVSAGEIELRNGVIYDPKSSRPFAGDYDLYEITSVDGRRLGPGDPQYERVMSRLKGETIDVQHGPHLNWEPTTPSGQAIKDRIIHRHRHDEPIYEFREDGSIYEAFAD